MEGRGGIELGVVGPGDVRLAILYALREEDVWKCTFV